MIGIIGIIFGVLAGFLGGRFTTIANALAPSVRAA
jgi:ABC-type dipeptide/oligopeptide/nickel transport system permease subunit